MAEEMLQHLEHLERAHLAAGLSPSAARLAARKQFGGVEQLKETARDERGVVWLEHLIQDFDYGWRQLRKAPGFAVIAIATLAIGIGATTAIFSIVNRVVLRPLAFPESDRLVSLSETRLPLSPTMGASPAVLAEWEKETSVFANLGAAMPWNTNLTGAGAPTRVFGYRVTPAYFATLGVAPVLGRNFRAEETAEGKGDVIILGHAFWQTQFGGRTDVIGRTVFGNGRPLTIIGVMPPGFQTEPGGPGIYTPLLLEAPARANFGLRFLLSVVARLKPGATLAQAQTELNVIAARLEKAHPVSNAGVGARATSLLDTKIHGARPLLFALLGAVGLLLLIACVNVANLLLARASSRRREIAVRTAMGASRSRIVRQLLCESLLLAVTGGALGVLLAHNLMAVLLSFAPVDLPRLDEVRIDGLALAFSCAVTLLTGFGFGLVPALQATRVDLTKALKDGGLASGEGRERQRLRNTLVVAEISIALMLLIAAGLLTRSFSRLHRVALGYQPESIYVSRILLVPDKYPDAARRVAFVDRALEQLAGKPGIIAAAISTSFPHHQNSPTLMDIEERPETDPLKLHRVSFAAITPDYFATMNNPLLAGRWFTARDDATAPRVVIVSEQLAKEHFPGQNPLGKRIDLPRNATERNWREIVGVVSDIRYSGPGQPGTAQIYAPFAQQPNNPHFMVAVRVKDGAVNPTAAVTAAIHTVDPNMPVPPKMVCVAEYVADSIAAQRFALFLFGVFSGVALLLAAIGIYGVMAFAVGRRTNEIGIRLALGAQRRDVLRLVFGHAARLIAAGLALGLAGAFAGARLLGSLLFEVSPADPATFAAIVVVLTAVALLACGVPARRATRVDPMTALRCE